METSTVIRRSGPDLDPNDVKRCRANDIGACAMPFDPRNLGWPKAWAEAGSEGQERWFTGCIDILELAVPAKVEPCKVRLLAGGLCGTAESGLSDGYLASDGRTVFGGRWYHAQSCADRATSKPLITAGSTCTGWCADPNHACANKPASDKPLPPQKGPRKPEANEAPPAVALTPAELCERGIHEIGWTGCSPACWGAHRHVEKVTRAKKWFPQPKADRVVVGELALSVEAGNGLYSKVAALPDLPPRSRSDVAIRAAEMRSHRCRGKE